MVRTNHEPSKGRMIDYHLINLYPLLSLCTIYNCLLIAMVDIYCVLCKNVFKTNTH